MILRILDRKRTTRTARTYINETLPRDAIITHIKSTAPNAQLSRRQAVVLPVSKYC